MIFKNYLDNFINSTPKKKGYVNIIISGGSSPLKLYNYIIKQKLNWDRVKFSLLDERLVNNNSKFSNYNNIKKIFKKNKKINFINLLNCYKNKKINSLIESYSKNKSLIIAGFGDDGHFGSIYQNSKYYKLLISKKEKKNIIKVEKNGDPFVERLTMNFSLIKNMKNIVIVLNNEKKIRLFKYYTKKNNKNNTTIKNLVRLFKKKILIYKNKKLSKLSY